MKTADLMVVFLRFRNLPDEQMQHFVEYVDSGRPIVGLRTSTHAFNIPGNRKYSRLTHNSREWSGGLDARILGETWINHHGGHGTQSTGGVVAEGMADHPILRGVTGCGGRRTSTGSDCRCPVTGKPLVLGAVLKGMKPGDEPIEGKKNNPMMPVAWVKTYTTATGKKGRVFTTTMAPLRTSSPKGRDEC